MVDQKSQVNGASHRRSPVAGFAGQAAHVMGDLLELGELQTRLAKADARLVVSRCVRPMVVLLVGSAAALASLPVLTLAGSGALQQWTQWPAWQAQLLVGGLVSLLAIIAIVWSLSAIRRATLQFERSATELANNIAWIKSVLRVAPATPEAAAERTAGPVR